MTTTVERTPTMNKLKSVILKENFWAFMEYFKNDLHTDKEY